MTETRAQLIERLEKSEYTSDFALNRAFQTAKRLIRDNQARERVLVGALHAIGDYVTHDDECGIYRGREKCNCDHAEMVKEKQQTLARINSGDWMES